MVHEGCDMDYAEQVTARVKTECLTDEKGARFVGKALLFVEIYGKKADSVI